MNIIDRARDALNRSKSTEVSDMERAIYLEKRHSEFAAEVVRQHDELSALADELEADAVRVGVSGTVATDETKIELAARIREALNGDEK